MVKICNYSSLIFAGNVTVLLIISMTTDYWEYRGFNSTLLNSTLFQTKNAEIMLPRDTKSYTLLWYKRKNIKKFNNEKKSLLQQETLYQPPIFVSNFFRLDTENTSMQKQKSSIITSELEGGMVVLFQEYGNLFRDCDALEAGVRLRLSITEMRTSQCEYLSGRDIPFSQHSRNVAHLERAACAFALLCMISMVVGLVLGGYGLLGKNLKMFVWASICSLTAGMLLTLSIALFHGKSHILRKSELLSGYLIPFQKIINESRTYSFGWSFVLAWICVFLCFTSSFVWLYKAQDPQNARKPGTQYYVKHRTHQGIEYMSYIQDNEDL
ncbi:uncharacterized protein LOC134725893 isoform X1 [Mytilus trossulus]|uniref:uncharacterized protein LOC134725893 isoform X1 n=1 Tax=Mytilus trossulus TaxID=6551 RepID=UPI003006163C